MKLWKQLQNWLRRTFNPTPFDKGYAWAKEELWWGALSEDVLIQCGNTDHRSNFDRGAEQAVMEHLAKGGFK
jgi:hypothetical protein